MKKLIKFIVFCVIVVLACVYLYKGALERFALSKEVNYSSYNDLFYYNKLNEEQKKIYIYLDANIDKLETEIKLGITRNGNINYDVRKAMEALYNDRPEYYFLPNEYNVQTISIGFAKYVYVKINYDVKDINERIKRDRELQAAVKNILEGCIITGMSDIEKEIAIHDHLMQQVDYYEYSDIESIPNEKHTSYGALVQKVAVCDGISKAMMLLLKEVKIDAIVVLGELEGTKHAWNIVSLDGEYYHLDATSNVIELSSKKQVTHDYFNLTDEEILLTHKIEDVTNTPKCNGLKYNYYTYNDYDILYTDNIRSKVSKIIMKQSNSPILELRLDKMYTMNQLLEALYFIDFSNWQTNRKTSVTYHNNKYIYVFENID